MFWLKKKAQRLMWTDIQIDLYERQMAAREALGLKWKCHPANAVQRKLDPREIPVVYPPKLRLVK